MRRDLKIWRELLIDVVDAGCSVDQVFVPRERMVQELVHKDTREIVDVFVLVRRLMAIDDSTSLRRDRHVVLTLG